MQYKNDNLKIVCVSNNLEAFNNVIAENPNINRFPVKMYDNSVENIGIAKRYNSFIEENVNQDSDFWIIFCHQDFGFNENPYSKIKKLSPKNIYGAVGVKVYFSIKRGIKGILSQKVGYYSSFRITLKGLFSKTKVLNYSKQDPMSGFIKRKILGQIQQGNNNKKFKRFGKKLLFPRRVSTLDCCCLIVHSSLLHKHNLRFDENLDWHMYVEDFCINCEKNYGIKSKAVQFDCYHLGIGNLNEDFYKCAQYVKEKHELSCLKTTCIDD